MRRSSSCAPEVASAMTESDSSSSSMRRSARRALAESSTNRTRLVMSASKKPGDCVEQALLIESSFNEILIGARSRSRFEVGSAVEARHEHDRQVLETRARADPLREFDARELGHVDVADDEIDA